MTKYYLRPGCDIISIDQENVLVYAENQYNVYQVEEMNQFLQLIDILKSNGLDVELESNNEFIEFFKEKKIVCKSLPQGAYLHHENYLDLKYGNIQSDCKKRILVIGSELIANHLVSNLKEVGLECVQLFFSDCNPPALGAGLKELLARAERFNLVIFIEDRKLSEIKNQLLDELYHAGIHYLLINYDNWILTVGPLIEPGFTACHNCYEIKLRENDRILNQYFSIAQKIHKDVIALHSQLMLGINFCITQILKFLYGNNLDLQGKICCVNLEDTTFNYYELFHISHCSLCSLNSEQQVSMEDFELQSRQIVDEENGSRTETAQETINKARRIIGKIGIISEVEQIDHFDRVGIPVFRSQSARPVGNKSPRGQGGKGSTPEQSFLSSVGESIERYFAMMIGNEPIITSTFAELSGRAVNPARFSPPTDMHNNLENMVLDWVLGYSLTEKVNRYVPANLVYFHYNPSNNASAFSPVDTSGLSTGNNKEEAILQGIYELIERDAYWIVMRNRLCMPDLNIADVSNLKVQQILHKFHLANIKVHIKLLSLDVPIPVVHVLLEDISEGGPAFTHGAGCHHNPEVALLRALTEAAQLRISQIIYMTQEPDFHLKDECMQMPVYQWCLKENKRLVQHLCETSTENLALKDIQYLKNTDIKHHILHVINIFQERAMDIYVVNLTRQRNIGFTTLRVLATGLQPADNYFNRHSSRLYKVPVEMGLCKEVTLETMFTGSIFT